MTEETQTESVATEPVVSEPVAEPTLQPEPEVITPSASEPTAEPVVVEEIPTAQLVEPLDPEPEQAPEVVPEPVPELIDEPAPVPEPVVEQAQESTPVPEPVPEPTPEPQPIPEPALSPQTQTSTPVTIGSSPSLARQLLTKARLVIQIGKRKKLEKIMSIFLKQASIKNDDVEKLLHVSDATATRYLDQLEREGKIKKENAGKYLSYSRM